MLRRVIVAAAGCLCTTRRRLLATTTAPAASASLPVTAAPARPISSLPFRSSGSPLPPRRLCTATLPFTRSTMRPRKRAASPAAAAAAADASDADAAPSPAATAKKRRAASASASSARKPPAKSSPSAKKKGDDENNAPKVVAAVEEEEGEAQQQPAKETKKKAAADKKKKPAAAAAEAAAAAAADDDKGGGEEEEADQVDSFLGPAPVPFHKAKNTVAYDAATMRAPSYDGPNAWRVVSWNVAGLRSMIAKHPRALAALAARERADALCLQETKLQAADAERLFGPSTGSTLDLGETLGLAGWTAAAWACSGENGTKKGYAGVAVLVKKEGARVAWARAGFGQGGEQKKISHDDEGRAVAARVEDASGAGRPPLTVVGVYVPNSGEGLKRLDYRTQEWDPALVAFVGGLMKGEEGEEEGAAGGAGGGGGGGDGGDGQQQRQRPLVVVAGDLNVAHREVDIHSPQTNKRSAGFTDEERASFSAGLIGGSARAAGEGGGGGKGGGARKGLALVDSFRALNPGSVVGYTYYSYRSRARVSGKGWRLDYCLVPDWCVGRGKGGKEGAGGAAAGGVDDDDSAADGQPRLHDAYILADVAASDHVPLGVVIKT